jgi:hypothetical protein
VKEEDLNKLDRLAAEHILGDTYDDREPYPQWKNMRLTKEGWQPTRNIAQAWELLERRNFLYQITSSPHSIGVNCKVAVKSFKDGCETITSYRADADTAALAITLAALKAKGVQEWS